MDNAKEDKIEHGMIGQDTIHTHVYISIRAGRNRGRRFRRGSTFLALSSKGLPQRAGDIKTFPRLWGEIEIQAGKPQQNVLGSF